MRLYEINYAIQNFFNETVDLDTGEIIGDIDFEALGELKEQRTIKLLNCGKYFKKLEAEEKALKEVRNKFDVLIKAAKTRADSLKNYILGSLDIGEKINDVEISISHRKPLKLVSITDMDKLPRLYKKIEVKADKIALKRALKDGEISGAILEDGAPSVTIK